MEDKEEEAAETKADFTNLIKKVYDTGRNDQTITVQKIIEEIKEQLLKLPI